MSPTGFHGNRNGFHLSHGGEGLLANLGPLRSMPGTWTGHGFNQIWRPFSGGGSDHFLALNLTSESLDFIGIGGTVPDRGLNEPDMLLNGIHYLHQINDANFPPPEGGNALHLEPGFWLSLPENQETPAPTVVRLASIPHGTTVLLQGGLAQHEIERIDGPPDIDAAMAVGGPPDFDDITPSFGPFLEQTFGAPNAPPPTPFVTNPLPLGINPDLVDANTQNLVPRRVLTSRLHRIHHLGLHVRHTQQLNVSTAEDGGALDIPFLGPNADVAEVSAFFWIEHVYKDDELQFLQLQYAQRVILTFNGIAWPHVSFANLVLTGG